VNQPEVLPQSAPENHCVTCRDQAVPMRVIQVEKGRAIALCAAEDGSRGNVEVELIGPVRQGDTLLVHAGVALVRLEPPRT
jgi:hydrogenase maturation factor